MIYYTEINQMLRKKIITHKEADKLISVYYQFPVMWG